MIKPVTFQGVFNFKANLYALEVKSRFIDQSKANGYYKNYGDELAATIIGSTIQIGTGAFVIQGRMSEITTAESVTPPLTNGYVGYVCLRQETYHPSDQDNTSVVCYVGTTLDAIPLTQQDTYKSQADEQNLVYELPIYSFEISNGAITNLAKLIEPCGDYEKLKAIADNALSKAEAAVATANTANTTSNTANETAGEAKQIAQAANQTANTANTTSNTANETAGEAKQIAETAVETVAEQHEQMTEEINDLAQLIGSKQGTTITINDVAQAAIPFQGTVTDDKIVLLFDGGGS